MAIVGEITDGYGMARFYSPFIMGGDVKQCKKFKVRGVPVHLSRRIDGFCSNSVDPWTYVVYEATTGGMLGEGADPEIAVANANQNILDTPDLVQQISKMPTLQDQEEVELAYAQKCLSKS